MVDGIRVLDRLKLVAVYRWGGAAPGRGNERWIFHSAPDHCGHGCDFLERETDYWSMARGPYRGHWIGHVWCYGGRSARSGDWTGRNI